MTHKRVVCAVIRREGKLLLARRAPGQKHAGYWEFPGGKVEAGETDSAALLREMQEEFGIGGSVGCPVCTASCTYPELDLEILLCAYVFLPDRYDFALRVHDQLRYDLPAALPLQAMTAADRQIAQALE